MPGYVFGTGHFLVFRIFLRLLVLKKIKFFRAEFVGKKFKKSVCSKKVDVRDIRIGPEEQVPNICIFAFVLFCVF